mmetsp:Transcript_361/g.765  ORF Transcript_361/g.765 Transcript_361/m.765 type:complete len:195 (-) Transcript_361:470-1054(-)|eukprot:CAMPEP_0196660042 /NCGR_PEP_ID=MMETSP1086-20130531/37882_1 /TAXON_ID=77921 /ORGANISM="Cyanoptyche  gloeocystis , Strain SAG4.97" /LENGTH=194 /DNA_ID=CAMNT_0041994277 /DNA_START=82 /DNA_END=666 /DNA_ORIENTATION=-
MQTRNRALRDRNNEVKDGRSENLAPETKAVLQRRSSSDFIELSKGTSSDSHRNRTSSGSKGRRLSSESSGRRSSTGAKGRLSVPSQLPPVATDKENLPTLPKRGTHTRFGEDGTATVVPVEPFAFPPREKSEELSDDEDVASVEEDNCWSDSDIMLNPQALPKWCGTHVRFNDKGEVEDDATKELKLALEALSL